MSRYQRRDFSINNWLQGLAHDLPDGDVAGYIALGGDGDAPAHGYALVRLPAAVGPAAVGRHMEEQRQPTVSERIAAVLDAHREHVHDLELKLGERTAYMGELIAERDEAVLREHRVRDEVGELRVKLEQGQAQVKEWRARTAAAEGEALRLRLQREAEEALSEPGAARRRIAELEHELDDARQTLARVTKNWRDVETKSDAAWRRVGEIQTELDLYREQAILRSAEQHRAGKLAITKAREEASLKLVGVRDQLLRSEARCGEIQTRLEQSENARAALEAQIRRLTGAADDET